MPDVPRLIQVAAVVLITSVSLAPTVSAQPTSPLCDNGSYRRLHPLICDTGGPLPGIQPPGGGGEPDGGLIGRIVHAIGGLL